MQIVLQRTRPCVPQQDKGPWAIIVVLEGSSGDGMSAQHLLADAQKLTTTKLNSIFEDHKSPFEKGLDILQAKNLVFRLSQRLILGV